MLTVTQAAQLSGMSRSLILDRIQSGDLPAKRMDLPTGGGKGFVWMLKETDLRGVSRKKRGPKRHQKRGSEHDTQCS